MAPTYPTWGGGETISSPVGPIRQAQWRVPARRRESSRSDAASGCGPRTHRLAFHLLRTPTDEALALAGALQEAKERVRFCDECGNWTEDDVCEICRDARRDRAVICVVEQPADVMSLERTHEYRGLYHVLGGALSPLDGVDPEDLRIDELFRRVDSDGVVEVVLATNPNTTGEATASFIADRLRGRVRVTRLASACPSAATSSTRTR